MRENNSIRWNKTIPNCNIFSITKCQTSMKKTQAIKCMVDLNEMIAANCEKQDKEEVQKKRREDIKTPDLEAT